LAGGVNLGVACYIGANSSIRQMIRVGDRALVGMGSVVLSDVAQKSVVVGTPAKFLRSI
jgi:UDP-3-O-[3-hydroxymyristoyl] glucosamine N-acyltransferase